MHGSWGRRSLRRRKGRHSRRIGASADIGRTRVGALVAYHPRALAPVSNRRSGRRSLQYQSLRCDVVRCRYHSGSTSLSTRRETTVTTRCEGEKTLTCHGRLLCGVDGWSAKRHTPGRHAIWHSRPWIASIVGSLWLYLFGLLQDKRARFERGSRGGSSGRRRRCRRRRRRRWQGTVLWVWCLALFRKVPQGWAV